MKVKGIIRGKTIELVESLPVPDGLEIVIEIPDSPPVESDKKWEQLQAIIGAWKNDQEITEIFDEINRERHTDLGQSINFDNLN
ncbi:MAG: hypothetical protein F6J86_40080 [Symploca sp. SIO1B1]|nr:hypothetical protein [Symploca sp. SIO1B1]